VQFFRGAVEAGVNDKERALPFRKIDPMKIAWESGVFVRNLKWFNRGS